MKNKEFPSGDEKIETGEVLIQKATKKASEGLMPKEKILPEKKRQIISFIKSNPNISIEELKRQFTITNGRQLVGLKRYSLGSIKPVAPKKEDNPQVIKPEVSKEQKQDIELIKKEEDMPEPLEILTNKVMEITSKINILEQKEKEKESHLKEAETKQERDSIKSSIADLRADMAKTYSLLGELTKSNEILCDLVPSFCKKEELDAILSEKLKPKEPEKPPVIPPPAEPPKEKKKGILNTGHEEIEDLLSCPECLLGHIRKVGFDKAAEEICKNDEFCKATIAELMKKGFKIRKLEEVKEMMKSGFWIGRS